MALPREMITAMTLLPSRNALCEGEHDDGFFMLQTCTVAVFASQEKGGNVVTAKVVLLLLFFCIKGVPYLV
ncbi:MAG: hypothetical protein Q4A74_01735 [Cardiobacteriaceae bacterium]|nr:hypothetical protein [Cardiobacteriaceae bacterium]